MVRRRRGRSHRRSESENSDHTTISRMPTSGPTSVPAAGPSGASITSVPSVAKVEGPVKQIAICAIQSSAGSSIAPAAPQTRAPVTANQFIGQAGVTSLGTFMINRFAPEGRQTVLLQPRGATGQPVVVTTSNAPTPIRFIPQHHTIRTIVPAPVSRNNSSVQLVNLSVSNPTANSGHAVSGVKSGSRPFGPFPVESVGLVLQSSAEASVRPIRVQTTVAQGAKTLAARAPQPKVINLTTSGSSGPARHNILLSPAAAASGTKPAILNLNKSGSAVIINPNSGVQLTGATANFHSQHLSNTGKSAVIPINSAVMTIGQLPRHHPVGNVSTAAPFPTSQRIITSNPHLQQHHVVSISAASSLKPSATPTHSSPVKQSVPVPTPASPRPSILSRKRVVPDVRPANQLLTPTKVKAEVLGKIVDGNGEEENHAVADRLSQSTASQESAATPRKKPRKQLLEPYDLSSTNLKLVNSSEQEALRVTDGRGGVAVSEERQAVDQEVEEEDHSETDDASQEDMDCEDEDEDEDDEETFSTPSPPSSRKPRISLFPTHPPNWKALQHHFLRYTDVKPKPEKKLTLSELSNEGLQKKNGWKIHHLATQMEDMSENESELLHRLNIVLTSFENKAATLPLMRQAMCPDSPFLVTLGDKLADLIRGNIQRSSLFQEQMTESKQLLIKLTNDHRERVAKLTKKNINKRTCISK